MVFQNKNFKWARKPTKLERIIRSHVFVLSYFIVRPVKQYSTKDLLMVGIFWMGGWLIFKWGGSLLVSRPVSEIIVGWNIFRGYMWPYVLLSYFLSSLIVGMILRLFKNRRNPTQRS